MKKVPVLIALFTVAVAGAAVGPQAVRAADPCDMSVQLNELAVVQSDPSLGDAQRSQTELDLRRQILTTAIACDQNDIVALQDALGRQPAEIRSLPAQKKIMEGLATAAAYYDDQKRSIPNLSIPGTKYVSQAIGKWRQATYLPLVTWADNFIFWADNQQFLDRASGRLAQAVRLAFSLKLVNQDEAAAQLETAKGKFETALSENDKARDALNQGQAADGLVHIKASLQALADTYQAFLELESVLQKIVK